jgi:hypothetical protein
MAVKRARTRSSSPDAPNARPARREPAADMVHTSLYLPRAVHDALREIAFHDRAKIHDLVMEAIGTFLKRRGYVVDDLKTASKR